jgi:peptide/nickel transport system substrate-binding protein
MGLDLQHIQAMVRFLKRGGHAAFALQPFEQRHAHEFAFEGVTPQVVRTGQTLRTATDCGDQLRATLNTSYHLPNRPFFDALEIKGGGDALSAARAVLQSGEFDFAWNLLVEDDLLKRLESSGRGRVQLAGGGTVEFMLLNAADPWTEVDGERAHASTRHPLFSDPALRQAMGLLVDRAGLQQAIWGRTGVATANFLNNPPRFRSNNLKFEFDIAKANAMLDAAGWARGSDGIRAKGGTKLKFVFQTSVNKPRQDTQAIIKSACQRAGIDRELACRALDAGNRPGRCLVGTRVAGSAVCRTRPVPFLVAQRTSPRRSWRS